MTPNPKHRKKLPRARGARAVSAEQVDEQWRAYHRFVFCVCAGHFAPSDDLAGFALAVANATELAALAERLLSRKEAIGLQPEAIAELEAIAATPSLKQQQQTCTHVLQRYRDVNAPIVDSVRRSAEHASDRGAEALQLPGIVHGVAELFGLSAEQMRIVAALFAMDDIERLANVMREAGHRTQMRILAQIAAVELTTFVQETAPGSPLDRRGLISFRGGRDEVADINLSRPLLFALRSNTLTDLRAGIFDETVAPQFALEDFSLPSAEVRACAATIRGGHPLLISGAPGIGKTEFARALINGLGRNAHTLAAMNRYSEYGRAHRTIDGEGSRFAAIRMAVSLLSPTDDVLIIDEADAILQSAGAFFGAFAATIEISAAGGYDKAILNDLLENLPVPTLWITNDHRMIPASAMRRFGHVFAFPHPTVETRTRMLGERLAPLAETDPAPWTRDLAARYDITPAAIERTARIVAAELQARDLSVAEVPQRVGSYIEQLSTGALAHDVRRLPTVSPSFAPQFCSASEPLERVERLALHRVGAGSGLRLLCGGPPGGGKTQYALWLAKRLGRDVLLKRPSDLLSKWVGESEQLIAAAFRKAAQAGSVLIIDEADALLYDRAIAQRSWEHSQIAEFLQQIQEYPGILIACTNRVDAVDPALRRRFHKHLTFGPVCAEVLPAALAHIFPGVSFADAQLAALRQGPPLMMSDLATAAEMIQVENAQAGDSTVAQASAAMIVWEILSNARSRDRTKEIGF